jgi:hypothetical protein
MTATLAGHSRQDLRHHRARLDPGNERGEFFRLTIVSDHRLHLSGYPERHDPTAGLFTYECGRVDFAAFDSDTVADRLDRYAFRILDRFDIAVTDKTQLDQLGVIVRADLGVEGYAHTVSHALVERLARIRAELQIHAVSADRP